MFVILSENFDPFMGGDYSICGSEEEVLQEIDIIGENKVHAIYNLTGRKDLKDKFLK